MTICDGSVDLARISLAILFAPKGLTHYWKTHYADKTFEHLYRLSGFDLALLIRTSSSC